MAGTGKKSASKRPFVFYNHGLWAYSAETESAHWLLAFAREVPEPDRDGLPRDAPPPARGPFYWGGGRILLMESPPDRYFDSYVFRTYGPNPMADPLAEDERELSDADLATYDEDTEVTKREATAFRDALDAWLAGVRVRHPLAIVSASHGNVKDAWSKWSIDETPARVLPLLRELQAAGRPPSEQTRHPHSPETLTAWLVHAAIGQYFELHDPKRLDEPLRQEMEAILRGSLGHDEQVDDSLTWLLRDVTKPAKPS